MNRANSLDDPLDDTSPAACSLSESYLATAHCGPFPYNHQASSQLNHKLLSADRSDLAVENRLASEKQSEEWLELVTPLTSFKRKRSLSLEPDLSLKLKEHAPAPLTKAHLQLHLALIDQDTMSHNLQASVGTSSKSKSKSSVKSATQVRECMAKHGIYREHANFDKYPEFKKLVMQPFHTGRDYNVNPESAKKFNFRFNFYRDCNEETYKHKMLEVIIKDEFEVLLAEASDGEEAVFGACVTEYEGVVSKFSARLREGYLPHKYNDPNYDKAVVKTRLQEEGMTTAEPDGIWAFDPAVMPQGKLEPATMELLTVCKKMHWPFSTFQCKLDAGYDETLNQAARDGATLNNVSLQLLTKAGIAIDQVGPNVDTFTYSMTMDKRVAQWWVHWTEVEPNGERNFHMNPVLPMQTIEGDDVLRKLRNPTHAIIEWGIKKRMPQVKAWYPKIFEADQEAEKKHLMKKSVGGGSEGAGGGVAMTPSSSSTGAPGSGTKRRRSQQDEGIIPGLGVWNLKDG